VLGACDSYVKVVTPLGADRLELHGSDIHLYPEQAGIADKQKPAGPYGLD
jgi:hypothetical protein